jgi:hypothetical protein
LSCSGCCENRCEHDDHIKECQQILDRAGVRIGGDGGIHVGIIDLIDERSELQAINAEMLAALRVARGYLAATEGSLRGAMGENLVTPDLRLVDAAIARAEGRK